MDMTTCVARRTRSKTESYLNSILNRSKGIHVVEDKSQGLLDSNTEKKRVSLANTCSPSPAKKKRRRSSVSEDNDDDDDDVEFLGTNLPQGKREVDDEHVVGVNVSESKSPDCDFDLDVSNLRAEEKISNVSPLSPDDDVVEIIPRDNEHVEDDNVGSAPVSSTRFYDLLLDDVNLKDDEADEAVSLSSGSVEEVSGEDRESGGESDCDEDANDSDYSMDESSDDTYEESSDSDFVFSEDEYGGDISPRDVAKGNRNSSERVYNHEKSRIFSRENNLNVFDLLAKSIWKGKDVFKEDICFGDENEEIDSREDGIVRESSCEKVNEQRKPKEPRSFHTVKEKSHLNSEGFVGGEKPCDGEETIHWPAVEPPPINLRFGCEEEPVVIEKTEEEKEIESLWEDMAFALALEGGSHSSTPAKNRGTLCSKGTHDFVLDEEIGMKCRHCSYVSVEIRDISPAMGKYCSNVNDNKKPSEKKNDCVPDRLDFDALDHSSYPASLDDTEGTVWQYVPGIKDTLYPHQQEGFEFIWKNLAGTTKVDELNSVGVKESGGCIISHKAGTGKTRLTIVFLQSYLERFPDSRPVVIAPASLMLTWEKEFRKWNANIPFYNMNNLQLSGDENPSAVSLLKGNSQHKSNIDSIRMVKLYSWRKQKSILGVSYPLYEKLAANKNAGKMQEFRRMLLELPGLLVLDEGHTPRNQNSCIWKVLTEVRTEKRIILSGTPFQNNYKELSTILCLARPAIKDTITSRLQELNKWSQEGKHGRVNEENGIENLKNMIAPFVHVYEGEILQEKLPGRRDCVVVLNPPFLQKKILSRIDNTQNTFEFEHKLSAVSVHPSLYLCCNPTKKENICIGSRSFETLKKLRLNSKEGVKTRFLIDFIRISVTVKEKVLVYSQYIDTLKLIGDQLSAVFDWTEGEEFLFMHGKLEQKEREHLMNNFNKTDSGSKVLLASTKACSEGINLVGASRVVILDVVWNPSVESQAISRVHRIGQTRFVFAYHLMVKDTPEWDKYCRQTKKHRISELVFSKTNEKDKLIKKQVVSEDKILDEMVGHEKLKDMFEKILYHPKESDMLTNIF